MPDPGDGDGRFTVVVDRIGLTLQLGAVPTVQRRWTWGEIGAFAASTVVTDPAGGAAVSLDLAVEGHDLHLVVGGGQLDGDRLAAVMALAAAPAPVRRAPRRPTPQRPAPSARSGPPSRWRGWPAAVATLALTAGVLVLMATAGGGTVTGVFSGSPHGPATTGPVAAPPSVASSGRGLGVGGGLVTDGPPSVPSPVLLRMVSPDPSAPVPPSPVTAVAVLASPGSVPAGAPVAAPPSPPVPPPGSAPASGGGTTAPPPGPPGLPVPAPADQLVSTVSGVVADVVALVTQALGVIALP
jgi:hypothetical protein